MTTLTLAAAVAVATNLPTVVVEASRLGRQPLEMAQHVEVMTSAAIADTDAKSLPELAAHVPGLTVYHLGAGNPAMAQMQMRGYGENGFGRVLVCVDGEYLNNFDLYAPNYARVPLGGVRKMEVLYGPQTVLHGDGASAGMINVVTDPGDYTEKTYGEVHGGSWGTVGVAAGTRGGFDEEGVGYFADMGYDRSDGYRDNSGFDIWNAQGGLRKDFANGSFLRLSVFFNDSAYDLPGPLGGDVWRDDPTRSVYGDWARLTSYGLNFSGRGVHRAPFVQRHVEPGVGAVVDDARTDGGHDVADHAVELGDDSVPPHLRLLHHFFGRIVLARPARHAIERRIAVAQNGDGLAGRVLAALERRRRAALDLPAHGEDPARRLDASARRPIGGSRPPAAAAAMGRRDDAAVALAVARSV